MKVSKLIELLKQQDQDSQVYINVVSDYYKVAEVVYPCSYKDGFDGDKAVILDVVVALNKEKENGLTQCPQKILERYGMIIWT